MCGKPVEKRPQCASLSQNTKNSYGKPKNKTTVYNAGGYVGIIFAEISTVYVDNFCIRTWGCISIYTTY